MLIEKGFQQDSLKKTVYTIRNKPVTLHYKPAGISERDLEMMRLLDEQHTKTLFYGKAKMREFLRKKEFVIGKEHVRILLPRMGLFAVFTKPNLSRPHPEQKDISISIKRCKNSPSESGMECRYYIYPARKRVCIFNGDDRLI